MFSPDKDQEGFQVKKTFLKLLFSKFLLVVVLLLELLRRWHSVKITSVGRFR